MVFTRDLKKNNGKLEFWGEKKKRNFFFCSANVKEDKGVKSLLYFPFQFKIVYLRFFQGTVFDLL